MSQRREIVGLQYLRGYCAIAVVAYHASKMIAFDKYFGRDIPGGPLETGANGVDVFFVISGFIISIVALQGATLTPSLSRLSFFKKRFARIVPLMWLAILSYAGLRVLGRGGVSDPMPYLRALVLFPAGDLEPKTIWTLRQELIFYIVFAASFLGPRMLRWLLLAWVLAPFAYLAAIGTPLGATIDQSPASILFNTVNIEFGLGFLLGAAWLRGRLPTGLRSPLHPALVLAAAMIALLVASAFVPFASRSLPATILFAIPAAVLVALSVALRCPDGRLSRWVELTGNASYSIYLFHPHFVSATLGVWAKRAHWTPLPVVMVGTVAVAVAASIVIHLLIEKPLVRQVQALLRPRPRTPPVAVRG